MAIPESIKKLANDIRTKIYGRDVREALASGIEAAGSIANDADVRSQETETKQTNLEKKYDEQIANMSLENPSVAEVVDARVSGYDGQSYTTIGKRMDQVDAQLAQTMLDLNSRSINIKNPPVPLVGASGDGVSDDTSRIQNVIDYLKNNFGGGNIYFPSGKYLISSTIKMADNLYLIGSSRGKSSLKVMNNTNINIMIDANDTVGAGVIDITIDGNKQTNPHSLGLYIKGKVDWGKTSKFIGFNILVENCGETGILVDQDSFGVLLFNIETRYCDKYGIEIKNSDSRYMQIECWDCGQAGINFDGANNELIGGKFSFNGAIKDTNTANFILAGVRNIVTAIDVQDGKNTGMLFYDARDNVVSGVISDSNGDKSNPDGYGFSFINSQRNILIGSSTNAFNKQKYGLYMDESSINNVINFTSTGQEIEYHITNPHNSLNGKKISEKIIEEYKYGNKGLITNWFTNSRFNGTTGWTGGYRDLSAVNNVGVFTTTGPYARISQSLKPTQGKSYFLKCTLKVSDPKNVSLGINGINTFIRPTKIDTYEDIYILIYVDRNFTESTSVGLYIGQTGVTGEVKDMILYELPSELAKLTADEINEIVTYNKPNINNNNDLPLGNGYKLSTIYL